MQHCANAIRIFLLGQRLSLGSDIEFSIHRRGTERAKTPRRDIRHKVVCPRFVRVEDSRMRYDSVVSLVSVRVFPALKKNRGTNNMPSKEQNAWSLAAPNSVISYSRLYSI